MACVNVDKLMAFCQRFVRDNGRQPTPKEILAFMKGEKV